MSVDDLNKISKAFLDTDIEIKGLDLNHLLLDDVSYMLKTKKLTRGEKNAISLTASNSSFKLIENRKFNLAERMALLAPKADPHNKILYTNLALAYLLNNKWEKAKEVYVTWKDSVDNLNRSMKKLFLQDLDDLERKGITHPNFKKVRELLKQNNNQIKKK